MTFDRPFLRYPDRHDPGRSEKDISDIIDILKELDERSCMRQLPRLVTDNIDKIPTVQYNEGDLRFLLKKMDKMESTIQSLQETVYAILARTGELVGSGASQDRAQDQRPLYSQVNEQPRAQASVVQLGKPTHVHSFPTAAQPQTGHLHPSVSGRSIESLSDGAVGDDFVFQENRKQRRTPSSAVIIIASRIASRLYHQCRRDRQPDINL